MQTISVKNLANDPEAIIASGHLDWSPVKMPLLIAGKFENRPYPSRYAIVHNQTGKPLDICSDQYHIHKPADIVRAAVTAFSDIGMTVTGVTTLSGGESIVLDAELGGDLHQQFIDAGGSGDYQSRIQAREAAGFSKGQAISARVSMKIGNTVGNPTKTSVHVLEIACLNSMTAERALGISVTTHRANSEQVVINLRGLLPHIQATHQRILQARQALLNQPATLETMRTYLLELSQPDLFQQVLQSTVSKYGENAPDVNRSYFLDSVNSHDQVAWYLLKAIDESGNRFLKKACANLSSQPMLDETRGTLYQPYMAATYATDHLGTGRGEFAQDNVFDSKLFGQGQQFKSRALDLVLEYQAASKN